MGGHPLVSQYFWSQIGRSTQEIDCVLIPSTEGLSSAVQVRKPKVDDSDVLARVDEDVFSFDITMKDPHLVQGFNTKSLSWVKMEIGDE